MRSKKTFGAVFLSSAYIYPTPRRLFRMYFLTPHNRLLASPSRRKRCEQRSVRGLARSVPVATLQGISDSLNPSL